MSRVGILAEFAENKNSLEAVRELGEIWGFHVDEYEDECLPRCAV